jgi:hypothetical protein
VEEDVLVVQVVHPVNHVKGVNIVVNKVELVEYVNHLLRNQRKPLIPMMFISMV